MNRRMNMNFLRCLTILAACSSGYAAHADSYPERPVRLIVGFPPGGATDLVARVIAPKLGEALGQQVVVDNRAGANGTIGADLAAHATPDGHNLHLATLGALVISPRITKVPYRPQRDFAPISMAVQLQNFFITHPSLGVKSIGELITLAKKKPGTLNYASSGLGSPGHLAGELFNTMAKVRMTHIPYKGGGPALSDLLGGQIPIFVSVISTGIPPVKAGKAIGLAVTGAKRSPAIPDVPTVSEIRGMKSYEASNWYGLVAPAGTPKAILDRLHRDFTHVLESKSVKEPLLARGIETAPSTPEAFAAYIKSETKKWGAVIRTAQLAAR